MSPLELALLLFSAVSTVAAALTKPSATTVEARGLSDTTIVLSNETLHTTSPECMHWHLTNQTLYSATPACGEWSPRGHGPAYMLAGGVRTYVLQSVEMGPRLWCKEWSIESNDGLVTPVCKQPGSTANLPHDKYERDNWKRPGEGRPKRVTSEDPTSTWVVNTKTSGPHSMRDNWKRPGEGRPRRDTSEDPTSTWVVDTETSGPHSVRDNWKRPGEGRPRRDTSEDPTSTWVVDTETSGPHSIRDVDHKVVPTEEPTSTTWIVDTETSGPHIVRGVDQEARNAPLDADRRCRPGMSCPRIHYREPASSETSSTPTASLPFVVGMSGPYLVPVAAATPMGAFNPGPVMLDASVWQAASVTSAEPTSATSAEASATTSTTKAPLETRAAFRKGPVRHHPDRPQGAAGTPTENILPRADPPQPVQEAAKIVTNVANKTEFNALVKTIKQTTSHAPPPMTGLTLVKCVEAARNIAEVSVVAPFALNHFIEKELRMQGLWPAGHEALETIAEVAENLPVNKEDMFAPHALEETLRHLLATYDVPAEEAQEAVVKCLDAVEKQGVDAAPIVMETIRPVLAKHGLPTEGLDEVGIAAPILPLLVPRATEIGPRRMRYGTRTTSSSSKGKKYDDDDDDDDDSDVNLPDDANDKRDVEPYPKGYHPSYFPPCHETASRSCPEGSV